MVAEGLQVSASGLQVDEPHRNCEHARKCTYTATSYEYMFIGKAVHHNYVIATLFRAFHLSIPLVLSKKSQTPTEARGTLLECKTKQP
eukprot:c538_g1_i1 orf=339-602(+)